MKLQKIKDLAKEISTKQKIIGMREGEKMDEVLISESEKNYTIEKKDMWIIKK